MGEKGHLTLEKGHLTFGGGASAPHAPPPPRYATEYWSYISDSRFI